MVSENKFQEALQGLESAGFAVVPNFLDQDLARRAADEIGHLRAIGLFKRAAVGKGTEMAVHDEVRRDEISWFDPEDLTETQKDLWEETQKLQGKLNHKLFLGLWSFEGHYAYYPAGGFYQRHRDSFKHDDSRTVSFILYLNQGHKREDGGLLRLYTDNGIVEVVPESGTLACFLSHKFEHEVTPSLKPRKSFTGWFKRRG